MGKRSLNIKNLVPRKNGAYRQGYYALLNPAKYIGDPNKIIFRSSWEKKFAIYCDTNERIIAWSSEPFQIPYLNPVEREMKPYNVDFYMKVRSSNEKGYSEYIVEVKPSKQLKAPKAPSGRVTEKRMNDYTTQLKTYLVNLAKFQAAKDYAKDRGWSFVVVTETFIF
jgi:hypothetical protein